MDSSHIVSCTVVYIAFGCIWDLFFDKKINLEASILSPLLLAACILVSQ